jgi:hypothetical protein
MNAGFDSLRRMLPTKPERHGAKPAILKSQLPSGSEVEDQDIVDDESRNDADDADH